MPPDLTEILQTIFQMATTLLLRPVAGFPIVTLVGGLICGALVLRAQRHSRQKRFRWRTFVKVFFKKKDLLSPSGQVDLAFMILNATVFVWAFGLLKEIPFPIATYVHDVLTSLLGTPVPFKGSPIGVNVFATLMLYLAYEFGYWVDHYISHKIPFLWHFHKVHHTANHLTFLTIHRVHPVDTLVFGYCLNLSISTMKGILDWGFGSELSEISVANSNVFLFCAMLTFVHLQHSGVWWAFPKVIEKVFLSPAQHQMHHAEDPNLYGCNLGSCLGIFDVMFGTWRSPYIVKGPIQVGVPAKDNPPEGILGHIVQPFVDAVQPARRWMTQHKTKPFVAQL